MRVRVRIAPAPSGSLHVGNVRTALYNWLFARQRGGVFVLRVEDTDPFRAREEHYATIQDDLRWLGLEWDEGPGVGGPYAPYRQSERMDVYREAAERLVRDGRAYRCYCTREELEARKAQALAQRRRPGYDERCWRLTEAERAAFEAEGRPFILRFHVAEEGSTSFRDIVTGEVTVAHEDIEDFSIVRSDGRPLYNLAATVDDGLMQITHVVRGLDLQPATPRQILLHLALGNPVPEFAHLPLIVGPDRQPLSKRHGDVSLAWYRENGFLPGAVVNYLAFLGWGMGEETILTREDLIARFSLEDVNPSPAMFDVQKLTWMNGEHIRRLADADLASALVPWLAREDLVGDPPSEEERRLVAAGAPLVRTRIERLDQAAALLQGIFTDVEMEPAAVEKALREPHVPDLLARAQEALAGLEGWTRDGIEATLRTVQTEMGLKPKKAFVPFYVAIGGSTVGAPLFDSMELIGRERCLERLERARKAAGG